MSIKPYWKKYLQFDHTLYIFKRENSHRIFLESGHVANKNVDALALVHAARDSSCAPRDSNLNNLKSKRKYQNFFALQESAESRDRILILKTCLRGAEVEK